MRARADGLAAVLHVELAVDRLQVRLDRVDGDEQLGRDLLVGHHRRQVAEHRALARAERLDHHLGVLRRVALLARRARR